MFQRSWLPILCLGGMGCLDSELTRSALRNEPVATPTISDASIAAAARVDQIGRQLVGQNPFLGVEPTFHTVGRKEPEVSHPDLNGVVVSEGLVVRCQSDDELAAVLAVELARMVGERRTVDRLTRPDPLPPLPDAGNGTGHTDPTQIGTQALIDQKLGTDKPKRKPLVEDPRVLAREIVQNAGFEPKAVDTVAPLLQEAEQHRLIAESLGGRGSRPRWSN